MSDVAYASAPRLVLDLFADLLPPERLDVATWAERKRWMSNAGGGHVGRYTHDLAPYTVEPSRCLTSLDYLTVAVVGPGQVAKTVIAENWLGHSIDTAPGDFLWYMQSDDGVESYVKARINPFIDEHEILRRKQGRRPVDDSLHFKRFQGMSVEFLAFGPRTIINKSAPRIVADEIDNYQWLGDVKPVLDVRRQTFGRQSKLLALSHPDLARGLDRAKDWTSGVMAIFADSTRCVWYWPCPHCGAWSSPAPIADRVMTLEFPSDEDVPLDEVERQAHLLCPVNGCVVEDHHRKAMNLAAFHAPFGGWIGEGQAISEDGVVTGELVKRDTAGFWIVGAMSPFVLGGIGGLAREYVKADRARLADGDDGPLRQVVVKKWGVPYTPPRAAGSIAAEDLVDRAEPGLKLGVVPEGVRFLIVAVDVQIWGFEYLVRGFGPGGESWIVDTGRIAADDKTAKAVDPATSPDDWERLLALFDRGYPLADGSGRLMKPRAMGYDSGGQPGVAANAYAAWRRWRKASRTRRVGQIGGREAWTIIPTKGATGLRAPRLSVSYPDTARKSNKASARGEVPVALFNPNIFKEDLAGQLQRAEPGDSYVHFPAALKSTATPHVWFEQLVSERPDKSGRWEKIAPHMRNEALDLMVLTHVVADLHGLSRIDWTRPPGWAAEWDESSSVFTPQAAAETPAPAAKASVAKRLA
ncbi:terminase gpA endonuclease subunit [Phenylobacterium sp.]|uniref:terminase gpA endonuclease subunit n=1 Tax=Phenylobacterium sp. TaxID=1871053 RepID=UPI0035B297DB